MTDTLVPLENTILKIIESTKENFNADLLREIYNIQKEQRRLQAEEIFNKQMVKLQKSLPKVLKSRVATTKEGYVRFSYSSFDDIMDALREIIAEFGFYCTFFQAYHNENYVIITCRVTHEAGHFIDITSPPIPIETTTPDGKQVMTKRQATSAAVTQGKKECIKMAFNITFADDSDSQTLINQIRTIASRKNYTESKILQLASSIASKRISNLTELSVQELKKLLNTIKC